MERSEQNADILYEDLKKNIMDVIKESQNTVRKSSLVLKKIR